MEGGKEFWDGIGGKIEDFYYGMKENAEWKIKTTFSISSCALSGDNDSYALC